ncbi:dehalogenase [Chloroflexota bacterium]
MLWIILGALAGIAIYWVATSEKFKPTWYEWVLGILGIILILFAIQNYNMSIVELEPRAANYLMLMFGLPGVILAGLAFFLTSRRKA